MGYSVLARVKTGVCGVRVRVHTVATTHLFLLSVFIVFFAGSDWVWFGLVGLGGGGGVIAIIDLGSVWAVGLGGTLSNI